MTLTPTPTIPITPTILVLPPVKVMPIVVPVRTALPNVPNVQMVRESVYSMTLLRLVLRPAKATGTVQNVREDYIFAAPKVNAFRVRRQVAKPTPIVRKAKFVPTANANSPNVA